MRILGRQNVCPTSDLAPAAFDEDLDTINFVKHFFFNRVLISIYIL